MKTHSKVNKRKSLFLSWSKTMSYGLSYVWEKVDQYAVRGGCKRVSSKIKLLRLARFGTSRAFTYVKKNSSFILDIEHRPRLTDSDSPLEIHIWLQSVSVIRFPIPWGMTIWRVGPVYHLVKAEGQLRSENPMFTLAIQQLSSFSPPRLPRLSWWYSLSTLVKSAVFDGCPWNLTKIGINPWRL